MSEVRYQGPRHWHLDATYTATIVNLPLALTPQHLDRLRRYVEALAVEAAITWDEPPGTGPEQGEK